MLARLDKTEGIAEARTDWSGKHVQLRLKRGASIDDVVARAVPILGKGSQRVDAIDGAVEWYGAGDTIKLSQHEAKVLGARYAREAGNHAKLDEAQRVKLQAVLTDEINALFARMHAGGVQPGDLGAEDWRAIEKRLRERCAAFATAEETDAIVEALKGALGMGEE